MSTEFDFVIDLADESDSLQLTSQLPAPAETDELDLETPLHGADPRFTLRLHRIDEGDAPVSLHPGQQLFVGRHPCNDLVIGHSSVSRFHAVIQWPIAASRPILRDRQSRNGTRVDGRRLTDERERVLAGGELVRFGSQDYRVELLYDGLPAPALLPHDHQDEVVFAFESRGSFERVVRSKGDLRRLLVGLEQDACTGTVEILAPGSFGATLTFRSGHVVHAESRSRSGRRVVQRVLRLERCLVAFRRSFQPVDAQYAIKVTQVLARERQTTGALGRISATTPEVDVPADDACGWATIEVGRVSEVHASVSGQTSATPTVATPQRANTIWKLAPNDAQRWAA